jgi:hypothetical protein
MDLFQGVLFRGSRASAVRTFVLGQHRALVRYTPLVWHSYRSKIMIATIYSLCCYSIMKRFVSWKRTELSVYTTYGSRAVLWQTQMQKNSFWAMRTGYAVPERFCGNLCYLNIVGRYFGQLCETCMLPMGEARRADANVPTISTIIARSYWPDRVTIMKRYATSDTDTRPWPPTIIASRHRFCNHTLS